MKQRSFSEAQIKERRQSESSPLLDEFKKWLLEKQPLVPPRSQLGLAISYTLERWDLLTEYLEHGFLEIDNNRAEQCIRPFTIGRKNWIFLGNERGGQAAAVLYSLIETAKANGLNTNAYLRHVMTELPLIDAQNMKALETLLPTRLTPAELARYLE